MVEDRPDKMISWRVVPFTISCGSCFFCQKSLYSACDNSNPVPIQDVTENLYGHAISALFG